MDPMDVIPAAPRQGLVERLAEQLGASARTSHIFGQAVDREGITVIPVGRVRYGFGGGEGRGRAEATRERGAGAGMRLEPAGFIEVHDGRAAWRPIRRPAEVGGAMMRVLVGAGIASLLVLRGVRALRGGGRATMRRTPRRWAATRTWTG